MTITVQTRKGQLRGHAEASHNVFLGIPYAAPPVGDARFRPPQPLTPWSGVRDALQPGPACPQPPGLASDLKAFSEDCLYLNVYVPCGETGQRPALKPVMVWIHGGGFVMGSGNQDLYDARDLAQAADAVVVTVNYRLGAFGFLGLPALLPGRTDLTFNNGLRDQLEALNWVQRNIEQFGGDPDCVAVFGQSAGAMSVATLMATPAAHGLFHRAICQSGGASHAISQEDAGRMAELCLRALDIPASHGHRLWSLDAASLLRAQEACAKGSVMRGPVGNQLPQTGMTLLPVVDGDLLPAQPLDTLRAGNGSPVPLLTGITTDEWHFFLVPQLHSIGEMPLSKLEHLVTRNLGGAERGAIALYRASLPAEHASENWRVLSAIESDRVFRLPVIRMAEAQGRRQATYMYQFEWRTRAVNGLMGACHAADLPFTFNTLQTPMGKAFIEDGPAARQLAARMMAAWGAFARHGNPSCEQVGDWPTYTESERATLRLGRESGLHLNPAPVARTFWDGIQ